ncbi:thiol:disulfide interchange protein DsbA [Photorhabdus laumondii subsp. laumondii]|uniref:Thiol:disulfide interchange protein n=3 Tax=Enterobacterales TaxID=91347 RepID=Q7N9F5_PHOLL|nr:MULTISPECIES: thiol:disulfide interchange protein DsbA [Photorhabdus]AWK40351.1 protein disulfide isomerase [Photorhabdus laumondii subsp. laumondii]AXG41164.1 thiol:disulfide interchange protein DsbA [Photorhabdus laumondii subsp. laumondii]AXG45692.1 thiol:disulfide interchange protein DsbA [Photorhabdus laumondii subsp. laumondii]KTL62751.1 protein disulfide isomerase [Photorhabdus laumondii subsp. laumondii]MCC8383456.1 thiol:disulfide interchange protein DsbA [Photorhabdus laumondii]
MKKLWLALVGMVMAFSVSAANFTEGKQYVELKSPVADQPPVLEFFSFYCPHCYQFEEIFKVPQTVKQHLPEGTKLVRYHVDFLGPLGKELTTAWAAAMAMGVEDKVTPVLFEGIQKTLAIKTPNDIRNAFIKAGVTAEDYDAAMSSFVVKSLVVKQQKAAQDLQLRGVPAMFVNGKYMVKNDGIDATSADNYAKPYSDVVNFLLSQK